MRNSLSNATDLRQQLDIATVTIARLRRVGTEYEHVTVANDQMMAAKPQDESGMQAFVDNATTFHHAPVAVLLAVLPANRRAQKHDDH